MISRRTLLKLFSLNVCTTRAFGQKKDEINQPHYIQINFFGAPARWSFDLPLFPYEKKTTNRNPTVANEIISLNPFVTKLKLTSINNVNYPQIWKESFCSSKGVTDLNSLYNNLVTIRGCDMSIDGHEVNNQKLLSPFGVGDSIDAHIARYVPSDYGPIHLLQKYSPMSTAPGAYRSKEGVSAINLFSTKSYGEKLFSFKFKGKRINAENKVLEELAKLNGFNYVATELYKKDFKKLESEYLSAVDKYKSILNVNYKNYIKKERRKKPLKNIKVNTQVTSIKEVEQKIGHLLYDEHILIGENIREIALNLTFSNMAEKFAISEVIAINELSSTSLMMIDPPEGINYTGYNIKTKKYVVFKDKKGTFDSHTVGAVADILIMNAFYFVFSSLLNEFVVTLKGKNKFDNTLIHLTSEFDRTPNENLSGSDHGFQGHTSSLIGGQFKGTECVGDVYKNFSGHSALHKSNGIWGAGAPLEKLDKRKISYRNITSTICHILKIKSLTPNDISLVSINSSKNITLPAGSAKNV
ncbi:MAG: DUF1501 domain-containing protein [Bacteriovoracaceae bacterium]|jgi:hypothetical protein|nr:DUF1501 domain-containing protein [Bacteriovoracaceae bacterium]